MRYSQPGWSSQPQGHKQLFKFQWIRCTICSTSSDNHQKKEYHTCKHGPAWVFCDATCLWSPSKAAIVKEPVSGCSERLHGRREDIGEVHKGLHAGAAGHLKMVRNRKANCFTLLRRIPNYQLKMCKFRRQISLQSPTKGLPPMALWHLVGVTIGITPDKNGSFKRSVRNWVL